MIQTPRLKLEPLEPAHAELLFEGLQDGRLYEFISEAPPTSVKYLRERYEKLAVCKSPDGTEAWLNWAVWSIHDDHYVGYVQATAKETLEAEIAYVLFRDSWGRGYAREAVKAMMAHLRDVYGVTSFRARVDPQNTRSVFLLQALGFRQVRHRTSVDRIRGMRAEDSEYVLVLSTWKDRMGAKNDSS